MSQQFRKALNAFLQGEPAHAGNYKSTGETLFYYCSPLLIRESGGTITFSLCGRPSPTAKRCINIFFDSIGRIDKITTQKGELYWGTRPITSTNRYYI